MQDIYQKLIYKLSKKYNISDLEIERIVDSQFRVLLETINEKDIKVVQLKHLGKFMPVKRRLEYETKNKATRTDNGGTPEETSGDQTKVSE